MTFLSKSLTSGMVIFSCLAQASCANGVSTLNPMTTAFKLAYWLKPAEISHISLVQTPVKAAGKKSSTVFFFPKFSLSLTSTSPVAFLDLRVKSGAFDPTLIGINLFVRLRFQLTCVFSYMRQSPECQIVFSSQRQLKLLPGQRQIAHSQT